MSMAQGTLTFDCADESLVEVLLKTCDPNLLRIVIERIVGEVALDSARFKTLVDRAVEERIGVWLDDFMSRSQDQVREICGDVVNANTAKFQKKAVQALDQAVDKSIAKLVASATGTIENKLTLSKSTIADQAETAFRQVIGKSALDLQKYGQDMLKLRIDSLPAPKKRKRA